MSQKLHTQTINALRRHSITDPSIITLGELLRIKGIGPKGVAHLAEVMYHTPHRLKLELARIHEA